MGLGHREESPLSKESLLPPLTPLSSAANMRSFHTQASTHDQSRSRACASCVATFGTPDASLSLCLLMSLTLPPSCLPSLGGALLTPLFHGIRLVTQSALGHLRYCEGSDSCPRSLRGQVSPLTAPHLPIVPSPTTQCAPISLTATSAYRAGSELHLGIAGSPQHNAESSSLSYGPTVRLRLLPTPPRSCALRRSYLRLRSCGKLRHGLAPC